MRVRNIVRGVAIGMAILLAGCFAVTKPFKVLVVQQQHCLEHDVDIFYAGKKSMLECTVVGRGGLTGIDGLHVSADQFIRTLVRDGHLQPGQHITLVCCHPAMIVSGIEAGVSYTPVSDSPNQLRQLTFGSVVVLCEDRW